MDLISADDFLKWARSVEIAPDERYGPPACLVYIPYRPFDRFWQIPAGAAHIPDFVEHLLEGMEPWRHCYLWPRDRWPHDIGGDAPAQQVNATILRAAGIPSSFRGAVRYSTGEQPKLISALFATLVFGSLVIDDLFVVPDHGRYLLQTDHHGVVHAEFTTAELIDPFVKHMAAANYALPTEPPDRTFKWPDWMGER